MADSQDSPTLGLPYEVLLNRQHGISMLNHMFALKRSIHLPLIRYLCPEQFTYGVKPCRTG